MTKLEFYQTIDQIIEAPAGTVSGSSSLQDLSGWDSLSVVAFIAAFDKNFGRTPPPASLLACKTVSDLAALAGDQLTD